jgi:Ca2+-binding RTX toxin-like protein
MASANIFWKTAIDFRAFDISVPSFRYDNNINRNVDGYTFPDQIRLIASPGSAQNNSFLGTDIVRTRQHIDSGTIGMYVDNSPGGFDGYIVFGGTSATALNPIIDSVSTADDISYLRNVMLAGSDYFELSGGSGGVATNDYVFAAGGFDNMYGNGGKDTLLGDGGNDFINGGAGRDSLIGGNQNDSLVGEAGNDRLFGGSGADSLMGDAGADRLRGGDGQDTVSGGGGADQFIYQKGDGSDTVVGWQDGIDKIRIEAVGGSSVNIVVNYSGGDATVTFMNVTLFIENIAKDSLTQANDFILVAI